MFVRQISGAGLGKTLMSFGYPTPFFRDSTGFYTRGLSENSPKILKHFGGLAVFIVNGQAKSGFFGLESFCPVPIIVRSTLISPAMTLFDGFCLSPTPEMAVIAGFSWIRRYGAKDTE